MVNVAYFRQANCATCHAVASHVGPDLARISVHKDAVWMVQHFRRYSHMQPAPTQLNDAQLNSLAGFLLKLNPTTASALQNAPDFAAAGALVYQTHHCEYCHAINGTGSAVGPSLNGLSSRRTRSWVERHFADPKKLSPDSIMPTYKLSAKERVNLTNYLLSLEAR
jgi:ubiquinol-cytochrome c reductase cytochrome b subunit